MLAVQTIIATFVVCGVYGNVIREGNNCILASLQHNFDYYNGELTIIELNKITLRFCLNLGQAYLVILSR